jgi:hypothetical protein
MSLKDPREMTDDELLERIAATDLPLAKHCERALQEES